MKSKTRIKVRGFHCDFYGHVNNARYLEFLEEARWEYLEAGIDLGAWKKKGLGFVVAGVNIKYRRPVGLNAVIEVQSHLASLGHRMGVIHQDIILIPGESLVAEADVTFAVLDLNTGRSVPVEGEIYSILAQGLAPEEDQISPEQKDPS